MNPLYLKDFYKVGHVDQYPKGTNLIFSNFTPRKSKLEGVNGSVWFGLRYLIDKYLSIFTWRIIDIDFCTFSPRSIQERYKEFMSKTLGSTSNFDHIGKLCELSDLPIAIYALPEGTFVPSGCPAMVIHNTDPNFFWVPGMLETLLSTTLWGACTSATIAREYRIMLDKFAEETSDDLSFVDYQAHDFSMRGMFGVEAGIISGMAHLQYFKGTDSIPALLAANEHYDYPLQISSVPATEHSVMSAGGRDNELETYKRLITEIYPSGIVSIVSDTWDLWNVVANYLPILKDDILKRDGKVVIRPDSGDPINILCGYNLYEWRRLGKGGIDLGSGQDEDDHPMRKGLIECLWDIFGGTINSKGYKQLDPHIGAIYGDSITLERCKKICDELKRKGFASTNIVFGIGSYTYQYNTRDTLGWAMKATYIEVNGEGRAITKNPITDDGTKKSHSGLLRVIKDSAGHFQLLQNQTWEEFHDESNQLKLVWKDGNWA